MTMCVIFPCLIISLITICLTLYFTLGDSEEKYAVSKCSIDCSKTSEDNYDVGRCSLDSFNYGPTIYAPYLPGHYYPKPSFNPGNCPCKSCPHKSLLSLPDRRRQPHF